jgi:hypothetical protein
VRVVLGVLALTLGLACGSAQPDEPVAQPSAETVAAVEDCKRVDEADGRAYLVCRERGRPDHGRFVVEKAGKRRELDVEDPTGYPAGHWAWAAVSPDGAMLLAQWVAECEVPVAYFVPAAGGAPQPVVANDAASIALGWTAEGAAEVALPRGVCGRGSGRPGVYAIPPSGGAPTYLRAIDPATDRRRG